MEDRRNAEFLAEYVRLCLACAALAQAKPPKWEDRLVELQLLIGGMTDRVKHLISVTYPPRMV